MHALNINPVPAVAVPAVRQWMSAKSVFVHGLLGALCLILVALDGWGLIITAPYLASESKNAVVINLLFLSTLHNVFTMVLVQNSPEFAFRSRAVSKKFKWFFPIAVILTVATAFFFATKASIEISAIFCLVFAMVIPRFHILAQIKGLSLNLVRPANPRKDLGLLWNATIILFLFSNVYLHFYPSGFLRMVLVTLNIIAFSVLIIVGIVPMKSSVYPRAIILLFYSKVLLFPLVFISPLAGLMVAALHGLEYASVAWDNLGPGHFRKNPRSLAVATVLLILLAIISYWATMGTGPSGYVALGLMMGASTVHYCYDAVLFRSRKFYPELGIN